MGRRYGRRKEKNEPMPQKKGTEARNTLKDSGVGSCDEP